MSERRSAPADAEAKGLDAAVERAGRFAAGRLTRRSFLGRLGEVAVVVAGGPALATLLADPAEGRVCGQSGVSPRCATFDCTGPGEVWGYCWYASGCCAGGLLKKICDCCAYRHPNVHGYCPSGHNVKCIVESCGADPRVQTAVITRIASDDRHAVADAVRLARFPDGAGTVVVADREWDPFTAVALPVAAAVGGAVLAVPRADLDQVAVREVLRLRPRRAVVVGPLLSSQVDLALHSLGVAVERVGASAEIGALSAEVAAWLRSARGPTPAVVVENAGLSARAVPVAGAFAAAKGYPLVFGAPAARALGVPTYLVGPEAAARSGEVPGGSPTRSTTLEGISAELFAHARGFEQVPPDPLVLAPSDSAFVVDLAGLGAPVLLHEPGALGTARAALEAWRDGVTRVVLAGRASALRSAGYYELQSVLNGYETDKRIGRAGQGLPVLPQPRAEQPVGRARR